MELDKIICGDCLEVLKTLPAESVDCCITSPPYYGLRDYGIGGQIGLEPTPEAYVARLVEVFREVKRVLKPEGTLFLNLGDSYFGSQMTGGNNGFNKSGGESGFKMKRQFKKPSYAKDARLHGTSGKEEPDSSYRGCSSENRHDGHINFWWSHISDSNLHRAHEQVAELCQQTLASKAELPAHPPIGDFSLQQRILQSLNAILDQGQSLIPAIGQLLSFQESTIDGYAPPLLGGLTPKDMLLAFLSSLRSLTACAQEFGYKSGVSSEMPYCTQDTALPFVELVDHIQCTYGYYSSVSSWLNLPYIQPQNTTQNYIKASLKPKDLIGIPWMVAFALRADGWYLRSDIIWHKPNCMPESVTDRPTKSHEYLFLLSKSQRYYYDAEAIKEECSETSHGGKSGPGEKNIILGYTNKTCGLGKWDKNDALRGRNKRTVWTIPTKPFKEAHFATFPEALVEPCILAGTSERGYCPECGKPWVRHVERNNPSKAFNVGEDERYSSLNNMGGNHQTVAGLHRNGGGVYSTAKTIGWLPSCQCVSKPRPGIVLDPFSGAGTVALVAKKLGRHYIGIELNPAYVEMAKTRINKIPARLCRWEEDVRQ